MQAPIITLDEDTPEDKLKGEPGDLVHKAVEQSQGVRSLGHSSEQVAMSIHAHATCPRA